MHCPLHKNGNEKHPSLKIRESPDGFLTVTCFVCGVESREEILNKMGLTLKDLCPSTWKRVNNIVATYKYEDAEGTYLFEKVRLSPKGFRQCQFKDGERIWDLKGIPQGKWPLYRLPDLLKDIDNNKVIVFVEGEKDVDRLRGLGFAATTLPTGANAAVWSNKIGKSAISVLRQSRLVFIPDNDGKGRTYMRAGFRHLPNSVVLNLPDLPQAGDVSDWLNSGGVPETLGQMIEDAFEKKSTKPSVEESKHGDFFKPLGYDRGTYFFMSYLEQQVIEISAEKLARKTTFLRLAPLDFWEEYFPGRGGVDMDYAANSLMNMCRLKGIYNYRGVRGRGVWMDAGRVVIHSGNHLLVDGDKSNLGEFDSKFVYERERPIPLHLSSPMNEVLGEKLLELCEAINWEDKVSGKLFAGWLFLSPICGALRWRPHIWIIGASGSGKTWIFHEIIEKLLARIAIFTQSTTTEAGIRQDIRNDSIPIIFDEIESDSKKNKAIIDKVLELARQASSESGGTIMKGSAQGKTVFFTIQSSFCFLSINKDYLKKADQSRIASLPLKPPVITGVESDKFEALLYMKNELMIPSFPPAFIARSCSKIGEIRDNAELIGTLFKGETRRNIDQYGTMIAGLWSLTNNGPIDKAFVFEIIDELSDADSIEYDNSDKDEFECFSTIMQCIVTMESRCEDLGGELHRVIRRDYSIGELIEMTDPDYPSQVYNEDAQRTLRANGIKTNKDGVCVANQHKQLKKLMSGTRFQNGWPAQLVRIEGTHKTNAIRFGAMVLSRSVFIPWDFFHLFMRNAAKLQKQDKVPF